MHRLSLCVIAKDEALMLPGLLNSVRGVVDEIVVVDTGSCDETPDIAKEAGARVVSHPWQNDFSDARNRALREATGDWILILDCDERLAPGAGEVLREAIASHDFDLGMLPLYNASRLDATAEEILSGAACLGAPTLLPRLMRRDPTLRWEGRVHESVTEWLAEGDKRVLEVSASILHLGNVSEVVASKDKLNHYQRLLRLRCQEEPENPVMWSHLARVCVRSGLLDEAWDAARCAWSAQQKQFAAGKTWYSVSPTITVFCFLALHRGHTLLSLRALKEAETWNVRHPNVELLRGVSHETLALECEGEKRSAHLQQAQLSFEKAIEMGDTTWTEDCMPGATDWAAYTRLGTVLLLQDQWQEASKAFVSACDSKPGHVEAVLGRAESLLGLNRAPEALSLLESLLETGGADTWILSGFACRNMGQIDDCRLFLEQAERLIDGGLVAPHRRQYLALLNADLASLAV
ncbi:MAG: glycosyltransferase family 2 protein [Myxococcota bacterium]|nr:glycosyltransferase family 2 protein [Myxococcota bacterium]